MPIELSLTGHPPRRSRSLAQTLVDEMSRLIEQGTLKPGDKLPSEVELMEVGGVSRSVVRDALSRLQVAGLVETRRGIGTFVLNTPGSDVSRLDPSSIVTLQDVIAILDVRMSFEVEAAGIAALRRTEAQLQAMQQALARFELASDTGGSIVSDFQFHLQIAAATNNRYFTEIITHFGTSMFPRARLNSAAIARLDRQQTHSRLVREHEHIYNAIARVDYDAARAAMRVHLSNSRARVMKAHQQASGEYSNSAPTE
ncbi:FadR/GntR family transcriptional regulator [Pseudomonas typographi]|uniref:FadR/GntR family transcriptional regulator n=1 Tax=Pseudomonas typographi TaxID=2715964 RepID=UPI001EEF13A1|nr:FadR/GntR family transcriptional regulator [Pseudomonas typographi]